jgi:hypothetical protein
MSMLGMAQATDYWGTESVAFASPASDWCVTTQPSYRIPSWASGEEIDHNAWAMGYDWNNGQCDIFISENLPTGMTLQSVLNNGNNGHLCDWTNTTNIPDNQPTFGVGRPYTRSGDCAGLGSFLQYTRIQNLAFMTSDVNYLSWSY